MSKLTLSDISSITNQESFIATYNANNAAIVAAIELLLSRDGTAPNQLTSNLDLNGFRIINSGAPISDNDVARLTDMVDGVVGPQGETGPPGSVADGDKGDVIVSSSGTVWTFDPGVVTTAARTVLDDASIPAILATLGVGGAGLLSVGTTAGTVAAGDDSRFTNYTINTQDTNYTFLVADKGTMIKHTSASAHAYTINPYATTAYTVGTQILIKNSNTGGAITLTRGSGVALYVNGGTSSANATIAAGGVCTLINDGIDSWFAVGPGVA